MKQHEVQIGGTYLVKIGSRLAAVTVLRAIDGRGRLRYECRTADTGRIVRPTAARLRPAAAAKAPTAPTLVPPAPVPGMISRVNLTQPVERLRGANRDNIQRLCAAVHVSESYAAVCRHVYRKIGGRKTLAHHARPLRRGLWLAVAENHAANLELYRHVMGHAPLPSEEMITAAMGGDDAARAAVLARD